MKLFLDITTTILGLLYILLEVRGSWLMWLVGFIMQALGIILYFNSGLYADCAMEFYYILMTIYGFIVWKTGWKLFRKQREEKHNKSEQPISRFPRKLILPWIIFIAAIWALIYWILVSFTNSNVPLADSFTTALSIVGIWALAHKYLEQWFIWIAVDIVTSALYYYKEIPFKASLYALYVIIAIFGYFNWRRRVEHPVVRPVTKTFGK